MDSDAREPLPEIDSSQPHAARVYDYLAGGTNNFAADREAAQWATSSYPGGLESAKAGVRANRDFMGRVVRYLAGEAGVRQFLDLGTGIPNEDNVHGVAQQTAPDARIVYVDHDEVVLAHAHQLLKSTPEGQASYLHGDLRNPGEILPKVAETLDMDKPVAVMFIAMLHLLPDDQDPYGIVSQYMDAMAPGSYLVITHLTNDLDVDMSEAARRINETPSGPMVLRTRAEMTGFLTGLDILEPGIVSVDEWRYTSGERDIAHYGAVGYKPQ